MKTERVHGFFIIVARIRAGLRDFSGLVACVSLVAFGCANQPADAGLAKPESIHWEEAQLLVEGSGFPAGAKGQLCLKGRWLSPDSELADSIERCVDGWAHSDDEVIAAWPSQGAFEGSLSLRFDGLIANVHGTLRNASFVAGAGTSLTAMESTGPLDLDVPALATWAAFLFFLLAITRTRAAAGFFIIGQALTLAPGGVRLRSLVLASITCAAFTLFEFQASVDLHWLALLTTCVHPNLLSWLRGEQTDARSVRALVLWVLFSLCALTLAERHGSSRASQLLLFSLGIYCLGVGHAWLRRRRISDDVALGLSASFVAQTIAIPSAPLIALGLGASWITLRSAPRFHWTVPNYGPALVSVLAMGGLELLGWLEPQALAWPASLVALALFASVVRVIVDMHGSVRQLSPIGAPDQTLPDLTLS